MYMNTPFVTNCLSALFVYTFAIFCGCSKAPNLPPPATLDDVAKATCLLHDGDAQGVLVGFNDFRDERVFLLTARHVATYKYAPPNHLNCSLCGYATTLRNTRGRWLTAKEGNDSAWIELTAEEIAELRATNALHYIAITNGPNAVAGKGISGTGACGYENIIMTSPCSSSPATLFFRNARYHGKAEHQLYVRRFSSDYNTTYMTTTSKCITVTAPTITPKGESGGPVFAELSYCRRKYWMLSGIIIGGSPKNESYVVPIDDAIDDMRYCHRKLCEEKQLW